MASEFRGLRLRCSLWSEQRNGEWEIFAQFAEQGGGTDLMYPLNEVRAQDLAAQLEGS
jgi:hypothetical protein